MEDSKIKFQIKGTPIIKFQSLERIEQLQKGFLYSKTLKYYRDLEKETGDETIGDSFETMWHINEAYFTIQDTGETIPLKDRLIPTSNSNDYVFCMLGINNSLETFSFSEKQKQKLLEFGDTALIILDSEEFVKRVKKVAVENGYEVWFDLVKYYNPQVDNANMIISITEGMQNIALWKREMYSYQQEIRFIFGAKEGQKDDHIVLNIGDISDISRIIPSEIALTAFVEKQTKEENDGC